MNVVLKALSEIRPNEENPRIIDKAIENVARSIKEFGFRVPIVINEQGIILAGHVRYAACQKLGLEHVPCVVASDLTEKQQKAFMIADNKVADESTFDFQKLRLIFEDLDVLTTDMFTGFNADEINGLMQIDTSILDDIESFGAAEPAAENTEETPQGQSDTKGDVPVFRIQLALFDDQKEIFFDAINSVKKTKGKEDISNSEAVAFICQTFLKGKRK